MKKLAIFLIDSLIPFHFSLASPDSNIHAIGISFVDKVNKEKIDQIASDEGLSVEVKNGLVISETPNKVKEAVKNEHEASHEEIKKKAVKKVAAAPVKKSSLAAKRKAKK